MLLASGALLLALTAVASSLPPAASEVVGRALAGDFELAEVERSETGELRVSVRIGERSHQALLVEGDAGWRLLEADWNPAKLTVARVRALQSAIDEYRLDEGVEPATAGDHGLAVELAGALVPTYLQSIPTDDGWGEPLRWRRDDTGALRIGSTRLP